MSLGSTLFVGAHTVSTASTSRQLVGAYTVSIASTSRQQEPALSSQSRSVQIRRHFVFGFFVKTQRPRDRLTKCHGPIDFIVSFKSLGIDFIVIFKSLGRVFFPNGSGTCASSNSMLQTLPFDDFAFLVHFRTFA